MADVSSFFCVVSFSAYWSAKIIDKDKNLFALQTQKNFNECFVDVEGNCGIVYSRNYFKDFYKLKNDRKYKPSSEIFTNSTEDNTSREREFYIMNELGNALHWKNNKLTVSHNGDLTSKIYYFNKNNIFLISDDLALILDNLYVRISVDIESAIHYLHLGSPLPMKTLAREVNTVPLGGTISIDFPGVTTVREGAVRLFGEHRSVQTSKLSTLRDLLVKSIEQVNSDLTLGILLSGGIDSAIILALANSTENRVQNAYTLSFDEIYGINEDADAARTASFFNTVHHSVKLSSSEAIPYLDDVLSETSPVAAWTSIGHRRILDFAASKGTEVMLSGLGSDELFFGYESMADYFFSVMNILPSEFRKDGSRWWEVILNETREFDLSGDRLIEPYKGVARFCELDRFSGDLLVTFIQGLIDKTHIHYLKNYLKTNSDITDLSSFQIQHEISHRLPNTIMPSFAFSKRNSILMHYPFLDKSIMEWAVNLNFHDRVTYDGSKWWHKHLVYELAKSILPKETWNRKKGIYTVPFQHWLTEQQFGKYVYGRFDNAGDILKPLFSREFIDKWLQLLRSCVKGEDKPSLEFTRQCWIFMTYIAWVERYS
jgi:asparagine synthetase B (glutamine-hydrolysing)